MMPPARPWLVSICLLVIAYVNSGTDVNTVTRIYITSGGGTISVGWTII